MRSAVRGTLLKEEGSKSGAVKNAVIAFVMLALVLAFILWFILSFGITRGRKVISAFMWTFWVSQIITLVINDPLTLLGAIVWAITCGPRLEKQLSWIPFCGAEDEASRYSGASALAGRVENVALMHAVGATVGLGAGDSLLVFSTTAALSAAFVQNYRNQPAEL